MSDFEPPSDASGAGSQAAGTAPVDPHEVRKVELRPTPRPASAPQAAPGSSDAGSSDAGPGGASPSDAGAAAQKRWKLVGKDALDQAVAESLAQVVREEVGDLDPELLARVQASFLREFRARIRGGGRSLKAVSKKDFLQELERSNSELIAKRNETLKELSDLESKVRSIESGEAAPAAGLRAAEVRARVLSFLEGRLKQARSQDDLGRGLLEFASSLVQEDRRRRGLDDPTSSSNEALDRYRRRIEKLRSALSVTEGQLDELARRAQQDPDGAATPLARAFLEGREGDEDRRALMQRLFEENIALREALKRA